MCGSSWQITRQRGASCSSTFDSVAASGGGTVTLAQELYYSGNTVIIDHGGGLFTLYAHLSEIGVQTGQTVSAGATIGRAGATGRVTKLVRVRE